jgi:hypothetical protein
MLFVLLRVLRAFVVIIAVAFAHGSVFVALETKVDSAR